MAPFGGAKARLGTNPICFAVPSNLEGPLFFDMATSAAAAGKINVATARGEQVPAGWLIDAEGKPSTDPRVLRQGGALLPLGGAEGYKGYGLAAIVEILSGLLTGLGFGVEPTGRHNDGCFIAVFNVAAFRDLATFKAEVTEFAQYLKATPPAQGFTEVLYPGEIEFEREQDRRKNGIPVEDATWNETAGTGARLRLGGQAGSIAHSGSDHVVYWPIAAAAGRRAASLTGRGRYVEDIDVPGQTGCRWCARRTRMQ